MSGEPWYPPNGVCNPQKHGTLISRRVNLAKDAGVPVEALWQPLPKLSELEDWWLHNYPHHTKAGYGGLLVTGENMSPDPLTRVGAMAGFLVRNFTRARVFSMAEALQSAEGEGITASCLLIPDFVVAKADEKVRLPAWRTQQLTALLKNRWSESGLQTVIFAPSMEAINKEFGSYVTNLIKNHFYRAEAA